MSKTIVENNLRKLKSWSKVEGEQVFITKPKDDLEFSIALTIIDNAIHKGYMTNEELIKFLKDEK